MYCDISACVSAELWPIKWLKTTTGVLQCATLSPYLFIVLMEYALKKTRQHNVDFVVCKWNGSRHFANHIGALSYADNIFLQAESIDDVKFSIHRLNSFAAEIGITINHNKTNAMHLGQASVKHVRFANGDSADSSDKLEYHRVPTSNAETPYWSWLSKAWAAMTKLRSIFNTKANDAIKVGLCRSALESIMLYRLEFLPLTSTLQDKLDAAYRRIIRYAFGVHFPDSISNADDEKDRSDSHDTNSPPKKTQTCQTWMRMANPSPLAILLRLLLPGHRRRRAQSRTLTWHQNIIDDITAINQSITSPTKSYINRFLATLSITWAFSIYMWN